MTHWQPFRPHRPESALSIPGCYVFLWVGTPIYVGQSTNVRRRIKQHNCENVCGEDVHENGWVATPWGNFPWSAGNLTGKVKYASRYGEQLMLEARLIRKLKPEGNNRGLCYGR
jgi:GIY-YIG catalytic domain-containing protein